MNYFKARVIYEGTDFCGWQSQLSKNSIQDVLIEAFQHQFIHTPAIMAASRTDAGVHSRGQIVKIGVPDTLTLSIERITHVWNSVLPLSIQICDPKPCNQSFNPMFGVDKKRYSYKIFLKKPDPFLARFGWFFKYASSLDTSLLESTLSLFVGKHDFRDFYTIDKDQEKKTVREISTIELKTSSDTLEIIFTAKGFLRHQIRRIVGTSLMVATFKNSLSAQNIQASLNAKAYDKKHLPILCATGQGLCLESITYKQDQD